jgi:cytoskeletal protein CcmA (bactofilin family)
MILKKKAEPAEPVTQKSPETEPDKANTVLAEGVLFQGDFQSNEPMLIHGSIQGNIKSTSNVTFTEKAQYTGDITTENLIVAGVAQGSIRCKSTVEIAGEGKVEGEMQAARLIMSDDAVFEGNLKIKKPAKPKPAAEPTAPANKETKKL